MATIEDNAQTALNGSAYLWNATAPAALKEARSNGDTEREWQAWTDHLAERSTPLPLTQLLHSKMLPIAWSLPSQIHVREIFALAARLEATESGDSKRVSGLNQAVAGWLQQSAGGDRTDSWAIECLAWSHVLPSLARVVTRNVWWELFDHLVTVARDAVALSFEETPLQHQWLKAELPLTLAYLFPEIQVSRELAGPAQAAFTQVILDSTDGEGLLHSKHWKLARTLLACWTRARGMGAYIDGGPWTVEAEEQYQWACRQAFRMMRRDGSLLMSHDRSGAWNADLFFAAASFQTDEDNQDLARYHLTKKSAQTKQSGKNLLQPAVHSEWAEAAVLRTDWSPRSPRLAVAYHSSQVQLELALGRDVLWSGEWKLDVQVNGQSVPVTGAWEEVCWVSDAEVVYLELEAALTDSLRVQRQILLARDDGFVLLADAVLGSEPVDFQIRSTLPISEGISFAGAEESREGFLEGSKYRALAMPIGLPEWRSDNRLGELRATDGGLELSQRGHGTSIFSPLWIDIDRKRMLKPCTWRQLTVAQTRVIQPRDTAVGYRVQTGKKQWLIYRSLAKPANRTVLGHNLTTEYLVAKFTGEGTVEALIEIE